MNRFSRLIRYFDSWHGSHPRQDCLEGVEWSRVIPFLVMHLLCIAVFWVGYSSTAILVAMAGYFFRMFAITAFYHRYFSHRSFETSRVIQFIGAFVGTASLQRGPLWWAAHHRLHHRHSDEPNDTHSPVQHSFLMSHLGWIFKRSNARSRVEQVIDLAKFPELVFLDRFDLLPPFLYALLCFGFGFLLEAFWPDLGTSGPQMLVWGFVVSTVILYHGTFTINSLAHRWGKRRYETKDDSRNNWLLAVITLGEGWHNNHHFYPGAARQGFKWFEFDPTWYILRFFQLLGVVRGVRDVPDNVLLAGKKR